MESVSWLEEMYRRYKADPEGIDSSLRYFFEGVDFSGGLGKGDLGEGNEGPALRVAWMRDVYRRWGHTAAKFHPFEREKTAHPILSSKEFEAEGVFPTLGLLEKESAPLAEIRAALEAIYCGPIGFEYMDSGSLELEQWLQKEIEPSWRFSLSAEEKKGILERLTEAESFEAFLHMKYPGQTRFSLEGLASLIPALDALLKASAEEGMEEWVIGMAHRGRLNVLCHLLQKPYTVLFREFEDTIELAFEESSDVKYHKGYESTVALEGGKKVHLTLSPNSSCLESTDGIVLGQARGKQFSKKPEERKKIGALLLHGDAALAGQGVVYETLQMQKVEGFATEGTVHVVLNNQIGYTTLPAQGRSTRYATDIAKGFGCPVLHVDGEDPEAAVFAMRLCLKIRLLFGIDVFLDLNGYRRHGHNEGDEPAYTQPVEYEAIRAKKSIAALYAEKVGQAVESAPYKEALQKAMEAAAGGGALSREERFGPRSSDFVQPKSSACFESIPTGVKIGTLQEVIDAYTTLPEGFSLHPKLEKWLQEKKGKKEPSSMIDWAFAECLAFGSLGLEGKPIRLTGQDVVRGTFSQRHAGFFDQKTGERYTPLARFGKAPVEVYNSILSEYGVLSFEFGYNWAMPEGLTLWEAQYGDFVIGGQIPIDHYLVSAEQKWNRYSSLCLLLPHGYEGAGPEHSSGRMERFLQLCAQNNIQVVHPTTPAQYFHLLRRQALRSLRKPLVVFTPKSLLRSPSVLSPLSSLTEGEFQEILDDPSPPQKTERLFLCTGKIFYDLQEERPKRFADARLIRLEQIYPFHEEKIKAMLEPYQNCSEWVWVQEEPENMGAWEFISFRFASLFPKKPLRYVGRARSGSTATGSKRKHKEELIALLKALEKVPS